MPRPSILSKTVGNGFRIIQTLALWAFVSGILFVAPAIASANENTNGAGYRNCSLSRLDACQNTNQLFFGIEGKIGFHSVRKREFSAALQEFLLGAPEIRMLGHDFKAADIAVETLVGPGSRVRLQNGDWFFDGFTPHEATQRGAVMFGSTGRIKLVATLCSGLNVATQNYGLEEYVLTIYTRDRALDPKTVSYVRDWARRAVAGYYSYPSLPKDAFVGIQLLTASPGSKHWNYSWLN